MMEWYIEDDIVMLLKTLKAEYLESTLDGKLCFSCPNEFNSTTNNLKPGQQDSLDSFLQFDANYIVAAPIISKASEPIRYAPGKMIADKARVCTISNIVKHSPMNCFRKISMGDIQQRDNCFVFALGDLVDKVKKEMGHDAYVLIISPHTFLKQLNEKEHFFAHSIHYGEYDWKFEKFMERYPISQSEMFQKSMNYAWQKEYRIVLTPRGNTQQVFVDMGSIRDIAIGGNLEELRLGITI